MAESGASFSLAGKVVVQCGGSGLLGLSLVAGLKASGATLVVATRDPLKLEPLLRAQGAGGVQLEAVDFNVEASMLGLRDRVWAQHGRVDGVVFNVVARPMRTMADPLARWTESMTTNATGFFTVVRAFGDAMAAGQGGSIVNIGSIQGVVGSNPWLYEGTSLTAAPDYFFHKGGMINLTRYLASHYGTRRVRLNTVSPGGIYNRTAPQDPRFVERYNRMTMLGRMAEAGELTGPVVFLLSDAASYITGANLLVDGGYTAK